MRLRGASATPAPFAPFIKWQIGIAQFHFNFRWRRGQDRVRARSANQSARRFQSAARSRRCCPAIWMSTRTATGRLVFDRGQAGRVPGVLPLRAVEAGKFDARDAAQHELVLHFRRRHGQQIPHDAAIQILAGGVAVGRLLQFVSHALDVGPRRVVAQRAGRGEHFNRHRFAARRRC